MELDSPSHITITDLKNHFSQYLSRTAYGDERFVIERRGKEVAVLVTVDDLAEIERLDQLGESMGDRVDQDD